MPIPLYEKLTDENLAEIAPQNVDAFAELIRRFEKPLLRYIMRISSFSHEEAEEILQEACLKAWRNLNDFDVSLKFSTWFYRIAHNETISEYRKRKSRGKEAQVPWDDDLLSVLPDKIDIASEFDMKLKGENVQKIIRLLPEKYRSILILKFLEEKNYEEISDILEIPTGTVATLVNRAKKSFRETAERQKILFSKDV